MNPETPVDAAPAAPTAAPVAPAALRPVKHGDVTPYAKRHCSACHGKGEITIYRPRIDARGRQVPAIGKKRRKAMEMLQELAEKLSAAHVPAPPPDAWQAKICPCAFTRFVERFRARIEVTPASTGTILSWKDGLGPVAPPAAPPPGHPDGDDEDEGPDEPEIDRAPVAAPVAALADVAPPAGP